MSKEKSIFSDLNTLNQYTILTTGDIERIRELKAPLDQAFTALKQKLVGTVGKDESEAIEALARCVDDLLEEGPKHPPLSAYKPRGVEFVHNSLVTPVDKLPKDLEALGFRLIAAQPSQAEKHTIEEKVEAVLGTANNVASVVSARQKKQWETAKVIVERQLEQRKQQQGGAEPGR